MKPAAPVTKYVFIKSVYNSSANLGKISLTDKYFAINLLAQLPLGLRSYNY